MPPDRPKVSARPPVWCARAALVILKSTVHGVVAVDTAPVIVNEITLVGSRCGRFEPALDLLSRNLIPVEEMISAEMPLADAPRAFERAAQKGALKVLLLGGQNCLTKPN